MTNEGWRFDHLLVWNVFTLKKWCEDNLANSILPLCPACHLPMLFYPLPNLNCPIVKITRTTVGLDIKHSQPNIGYLDEKKQRALGKLALGKMASVKMDLGRFSWTLRKI